MRSRTNTHNVWKETTQKKPGDNTETKHRMRTVHIPTSTESTEISLYPRPLVESSDGLHSTEA